MNTADLAHGLGTQFGFSQGGHIYAICTDHSHKAVV